MCHHGEMPHISDAVRVSFAQGIVLSAHPGVDRDQGIRGKLSGSLREAEKAFRFRDEKSRFRSFLQNIEGCEKLKTPTWFDFRQTPGGIAL